ncbi:MAG: potassium channel family protein [Hyphomicrobiaceae bacterium]
MIGRSKATDDAFRHMVHWRWSLLLGSLIFTYILDSVIEQNFVAELISRLLYVAIFTGVILSVDLPSRVSRFALAVVFVWPVISFLNIMLSTEFIALADLIFVVTILVGCLILVFYELSRKRGIAEDTIPAAIFGYLLVALAFALFYSRLERLQPGSFNFGDSSGDASSLVYFSLVTITTLGFGDITPASRLARVVVGIEAAAGIMYVAIFIGRIVGRR